MNAIYLSALWMFYYTLHSALATEGIKRFFDQRLPALAAHYRLLYSFFAVVNFLLLLWLHSIAPSPRIFDPAVVVVAIALLIGVSGGVVILFALRRYRIRFLFTDISRSEESAGGLITTGLNAYVRHPLYFGMILILISCFLAFPNWKNAGFAIVSFIYIAIGSLLEERKLLDYYGTEYAAYRKKVKMLIPYLV